MPGLRPALVAASLLGLAALPVSATVDTQVDLPLKAQGSLLPEGESDLLRFRALAGASLDLSVSADRGLSLQVEILDADGVPVDPGDARIAGTGAKFSAKGLVLPSTGSYALRIAGAGTGEYRLSAKAKPPAKFSWKGEPLDDLDHLLLDLAAPAGSRLTLQAKASKGSKALPRIAGLDGPGFSLDLREQGTLKASSHKVIVESTDAGGDLVLRVRNDGDTAGAIDVSVAVKAPKTATTVLDLRAATLGQPSGGETWITRTVRSTDDASVFEEDGACGAAGAGIVVPGTGWSGQMRIDVATAPDLPLPGPEWMDVGPAVRFLSSAGGPAGSTLHAPVDLELLPANRLPSDIRLLARDGDGPEAFLPEGPYAFDGGSGMDLVTAALPADRTLQPVVLRGTPRMEARFWGLEANWWMDPDFADDDSRSREAEVGALELTLAGGGAFSGTLDQRRLAVVWGQGGYPTIVPSSGASPIAGTWAYGGDGRSMTVAPDGGEGPMRFDLSADGSVAAAEGFRPGDSSAGIMLLLRRGAAAPAAEDLAGTWGLCGLGLRAPDSGGQGGEISLYRFQGKVVLRADGTFSMNGSQRAADALTTGWISKFESIVASGTFTVDSGGRAVLSIEGEDAGKELRFLAGEGARAALVLRDGGDARDSMAAVAVRLGAAPPPAGEHALRVFDISPSEYSAQGPITVHDFNAGIVAAVMSPGAGSSFSGSGANHYVSRNPGTAGGVEIEDGSFSFSVGVSIDAKGTLVVTDPEGGRSKGWMADGGGLGVFIADVADARTVASLGFFFPLADPGD